MGIYIQHPIHEIRVEKQNGIMPKEEQFAWKIAMMAAEAHKVELDSDVIEMIRCRIIDNAAIAIAAVNETPVAVARDMALHTEGTGGATIYGIKGKTFCPRYAAFYNSVAVRLRDQDDTYLNLEYSHPDDSISALIAVAQQMGCTGKDLLRGIAVAYEVHVALVGTGDGTGICLHKHKVDHMTHIAAATAAGIGAMLNLPVEQIYNAINFAVHNAVSSRQSRNAIIGAQKEYVPGISAITSMDAIHWAMNGTIGPNPVYEGRDSLIARFLDGPDSVYKVALAEPGKGKFRNIMITYPKEHAFEYQGQPIIDLVLLDIRDKLPKRDDGSIDISQIKEIKLRTSQHTHTVIGTGLGSAKLYDIDQTRGTLDHNILFAISRAIQLGKWDETVYDVKSLGNNASVEDRQRREFEREELSALMNKIHTEIDPRWEAAYKDMDPNKRAFGGQMIITLADGRVIETERGNARAHPNSPEGGWTMEEYIKKFDTLTAGYVSRNLRDRFLRNVLEIDRSDFLGQNLSELIPSVDETELKRAPSQGIYGAYNSNKLAVANNYGTFAKRVGESSWVVGL